MTFIFQLVRGAAACTRKGDGTRRETGRRFTAFAEQNKPRWKFLGRWYAGSKPINRLQVSRKIWNLTPAMLLSPNRNPAFCPAMRDVRTVRQKEEYYLTGEDTVDIRASSTDIVEDGVDVGNNNDGDDDDDDDEDDAKDDDVENGDEEGEDDSSACKRITLRGRTKTANPVILFQTRRQTAASRKESKRSTTSN